MKKDISILIYTFILIVLVLLSSCSTIRHQMNRDIGKDEPYLLHKYGKPDSSILYPLAKIAVKALLFTNKSTLGQFGSPMLIKRYYLLDSCGLVIDWHYIQWSKDEQDRRILSFNH